MITWPYVLRAGHVDDPAGGACAMDAVNWLIHGKHGDKPECASLVIGEFVIVGNDEMPDDVRQRLIPYLHRISGSRSAEHEADRLRVLVLGAARVFAADAVEGAGGDSSPLRSLGDDASYDEILATAKLASEAAVMVGRLAAAAAARWATKSAAAATEATAWATKSAAKSAAVEASEAAAARWAAKSATLEARLAVETAAEAAASVWGDYFAVLDAALSAGPQGEPWSADVAEAGARAFQKAGGRAPILEPRDA